MKRMKHFCIMLLIAVFTASGVASSALAACECPLMQSQQQVSDSDTLKSSPMPCHETAQSDDDGTHHDMDMADGSGDDINMECDTCSCTDCHVTQTSMLANSLLLSANLGGEVIALHPDARKSHTPSGLDNPPKQSL